MLLLLVAAGAAPRLVMAVAAATDREPPTCSKGEETEVRRSAVGLQRGRKSTTRRGSLGALAAVDIRGRHAPAVVPTC